MAGWSATVRHGPFLPYIAFLTVVIVDALSWLQDMANGLKGLPLVQAMH